MDQFVLVLGSGDLTQRPRSQKDEVQDVQVSIRQQWKESLRGSIERQRENVPARAYQGPQSVEHETLNLRVVGSSPKLGANVRIGRSHATATITKGRGSRCSSLNSTTVERKSQRFD